MLLETSWAALEDAGCFAIVLESVVEQSARKITKQVTVPTIGIGCGTGNCDGEIAVTSDVIGSYPWFVPPFATSRADVAGEITKSVAAYVAACQNSNVEVAKLLLDRGAVSQRTRLGEGPLHVAAREGNVSLARALLAKPWARKELQLPAAHGRTPLHTAVAHGRKAMVALLLGQPECGRGAADSRGMTAVHLAVAGGDVAMLGQLAGARAGPGASRTAEVGQLDEFCARNQLGWCALHTAAFRGQVGCRM